MRNPLEEYRRIQRTLRREFDAFTRVHCPTCVTPCCRKPARIAPTDILLAQGVGWKPPAGLSGDLVVNAAGDLATALDAVPAQTSTPCDFLGASGCSFPPDLRPFGCTAFICPVMYERLDRKTLGRMKRLVRELDRAHQILVAHLHRFQAGDAEEAELSERPVP